MSLIESFIRRRRRSAMQLLVALTSLWMTSCQKAPSVSAARSLVVIVSCDTAGWIVPCGCSSKQAGGLLRRATYVQDLRKSADVLLADAGGAPGGVSAYDRLKFEAVLRGEIEMQTVAHNIGAAEAELGAQSLREINEKLHAPLISSNVFDAESKEIVPSHRIIAIGGRRIAVAGVLSRKYSRHGLQIDDPHESLMRLVRILSGQFDHLLILAYLPEEELETLVARIPEADMIVGGPTQQTIAPRRAGPSIWGATTNRGKFLVQLERSGQDLWVGKIVELDHLIADDDAQSKNLKRFRDDLSRIDFAASQTSFAPVLAGDSPKEFMIAGTEACQKCHANDCRHWSDSQHAQAWKTLVAKESQMDPYCQQCHTTGYGQPGGFLSMAAGSLRHNVGCESCHGPARAHVLQPATRTIYNARDRCIQCHDHDNSPQFDYDKFWTTIAHGEPANSAKDQ